MKKILLVHNNYRLQGGEDIAVKNELKLLEKKYQVKSIFFENKIESFNDIFAFFTFNNRTSNKKILNTVDEFKPDIVYFHNNWFKVSVGIFKKLRKKNIKVIIKLHNFRYHCTKSFGANVHLENNNFCHACGFDKSESKLFNKYYRESLLKSIYAIFFGKKYLQIIKDTNIYLAVLTNFHKKFLEENYYRKKNVVVIPNFLDKNENEELEENFFIYAGRISKEKGVDTLIDSFLNSNLKNNILKIVGDGPQLNYVKEKYTEKNIVFLGQISNRETIELIKKSKGVLSATKLYEGQPTLLCEASLCGKVSLFPNSGGIAEFLPKDYEFTFDQFNYKDLIDKLNLLNNEILRKNNSKKAKEFIIFKLDENNIIQQFNQVINENE
tara:strand:- start:1676 stop:2821 length:1146 start_codon:yes stop_codon:yes gene_type:complete